MIEYLLTDDGLTHNCTMGNCTREAAYVLNKGRGDSKQMCLFHGRQYAERHGVKLPMLKGWFEEFTELTVRYYERHPHLKEGLEVAKVFHRLVRLADPPREEVSALLKVLEGGGCGGSAWEEMRVQARIWASGKGDSGD